MFWLLDSASFSNPFGVFLKTAKWNACFFFLEPRRRTARHFIKVEKKYNGLDRPHLAPIKVPLTTNYIRATGYDGNDPTIPGLGQVFTGPASSWLQALVGPVNWRLYQPSYCSVPEHIK